MATDLSSPSIAGCTLDKALTNKIRRDLRSMFGDTPKPTASDHSLFRRFSALLAPIAADSPYSHSIVPGGFEVKS